MLSSNLAIGNTKNKESKISPLACVMQIAKFQHALEKGGVVFPQAKMIKIAAGQKEPK